MPEYLEPIAVVPVKPIVGADPGKTSFVLDDAVYFVM